MQQCPSAFEFNERFLMVNNYHSMKDMGFREGGKGRRERQREGTGVEERGREGGEGRAEERDLGSQ